MAACPFLWRLRRRGAERCRAPADLGEGERAMALEQAIDEMPEEVRRCFILRYHRGFAHDEIAELMRIPAREVRRHLAEARRRLDPWLEGAED